MFNLLYIRIAATYTNHSFGASKSSMKSTGQRLTLRPIWGLTREIQTYFRSWNTSTMRTKKILLRWKSSLMFHRWFSSIVNKGKLGSVSSPALEVFWACASVSALSVLWKSFGFVSRLENHFVTKLFKYFRHIWHPIGK